MLEKLPDASQTDVESSRNTTLFFLTYKYFILGYSNHIISNSEVLETLNHAITIAEQRCLYGHKKLSYNPLSKKYYLYIDNKEYKSVKNINIATILYNEIVLKDIAEDEVS